MGMKRAYPTRPSPILDLDTDSRPPEDTNDYHVFPFNRKVNESIARKSYLALTPVI